MPVGAKFTASNWRNWTQKQGIPYVQPPTEVVRRLFAIRINIDECTGDNGGLLLAPGGHATLTDQPADKLVEGEVGDALLMSPLPCMHPGSPNLAHDVVSCTFCSDQRSRVLRFHGSTRCGEQRFRGRRFFFVSADPRSQILLPGAMAEFWSFGSDQYQNCIRLPGYEQS